MTRILCVNILFHLGFCAASAFPQVEEDWVARYDGPGGAEQFRDMAVDSAGNVYVTGTAYNNNSTEALTVKYDREGKELWVRRYGGTEAIGAAVPQVLILDAKGDLYVAGEAFLVKYDADGNILWERSGVSIFSAATDATGNVYVLGTLSTAETPERVTIKYSATGEELWTIHNPGACSLALDAEGNVFILGFANLRQPHQGMATGNFYIERYTPDGDLDWEVSYEEEILLFVMLGGPYIDWVLDSSGSPIVTGYLFKNGSPNSGVIVKFNSEGEQLWEVVGDENLGGDVEVDGEDNIYVANNSHLVKYDPAGKEIAILPGGWYLLVDEEGTYYVTTESSDHWVTVKYDTHGMPMWEARTEAKISCPYVMAIQLDHEGNFLVAGSIEAGDSFGLGCDGGSYFTVKYDQEGNQLWSARYDRPGGHDISRGLAVDSEGNVYVANQSSYRGMGGAQIMLKYGPEGDLLWESHPIQGGSPRSLYVDDEGQAHVSGSTGLTVKYDSEGSVLWSVQNRRNPGMFDEAALAVDHLGNVFVPRQSGNESFVVKYDSDGNERWFAAFEVPDGSWEDVYAMVTDVHGNLIVTGYNFVPFPMEIDDHDIYTAKYDPEGNQLWAATYNRSEEIPISMALDDGGNIYVAGRYSGSIAYDIGLEEDYLVIKYDRNGNELWAVTHDSGEDDELTAMAVDGQGHVYLMGGMHNYELTGEHHYSMVKLDSRGRLEWVRTFEAEVLQQATDLALDPAGNVFVTGVSSLDSWTTLKYSPGGEQLWLVQRLSGFPGALVVDEVGNIYVTGGSNGDTLTIKYSQAGLTEYFLRGDCNGDGELNLTDVIKYLNFQFAGLGNLDCLDAADIDDDGELTITDAIRSLNYQFTGTAAAPEHPGPFKCGVDLTIDELKCESFEGCP